MEAFSSSAVNTKEVQVDEVNVTLTDYPGYPSYREQLFSSVSTSTTILLCVNTLNK